MRKLHIYVTGHEAIQLDMNISFQIDLDKSVTILTSRVTIRNFLNKLLTEPLIPFFGEKSHDERLAT